MKLLWLATSLLAANAMWSATTFAATVNDVPGSVILDNPTSGWQNSTLDHDAANFMQDVHYPASDVNTRAGQSRMAMISGKILRDPKSQTQNPKDASSASDAYDTSSGPPATAIVNGVDMPVRIQPDGGFSRPWVFANGSNSVEIRSPDGKHVARSQLYEADSGRVPAKIRVLLAWSTDMTDLDLHVITPTGEHCWYGNRTLKNGGALDIDVTDGYGPEIFQTPVAERGRYYVYVNYYGGAGSVNGGPAPITVAHITVITNENTVDEKKQTFIVPMRRPGDLTLVSSFVY
jgi:uncharacterized protein YfaP (DUF2135 family)